MTFYQSFILGIVQGITEFIPISSSGHLVIIPYLLQWNLNPELAFIFDVLVQVATLLAVIAYFWRDLYEILKQFILGLWNRKPFTNTYARMGWLLIIATIPAGIIGIIAKDVVENAFSSILLTGIALLVNAFLLALAEKLGKRNRQQKDVTPLDSLIIGLFQSMAIFPGLSRSGSTIAGGVFRNLDRKTAARFSFLMSIPIMLAAGLFASFDLRNIPNLISNLLVFLPGFISSAVVGYLSIRWLLDYVSKHSLYIFSIYCSIVGLLVILIYLLRQ